MPDQTNLQEKHFNVRVKEADFWTQKLVEFIKKKGHIDDFRKATKEEDRDLLIDYWFKYPGEQEYKPIGFKLRIDPARRDIPVVYNQPFFGTNSPKTVLGRDYRCLLGDVVQYYVAVKNADKEFEEIYRISKSKLLPLVNGVVSSWKKGESAFTDLIPYDSFTSDHDFLQGLQSGKRVRRIWRTNQAEVWWQKNPNENYSKINLYIPEEFKEESIQVPFANYKEMLKDYQSN